jgi:hypothetical protein
MKLEDIDGEVYMTDSLLESLQDKKQVTNSTPKYTVVVDNSPVGLLKSFKSSPPLLELEFDTAIDPGKLIGKIAGKHVLVQGMELGLSYVIGEISCNVETLRCALKAIHIQEVTDVRREPDLRVRQVHGVDREDGEDEPTGEFSYPR